MPGTDEQDLRQTGALAEGDAAEKSLCHGRHFLWNIRLISYGLPVLLFNISSSGVTRNYAPVRTSKLAWICSGILLLVVTSGLIWLLRERQYWWEKWLKERVWGWLLLATGAIVTAGVMIRQRPRRTC